MAHNSFFKKILITGACLCALFPKIVTADELKPPVPTNKVHSASDALSGTVLNEHPPRSEPIPAIQLPPDETVTSIVSKIIEHGDLRDSDFIKKLLNISDKRSLPLYLMKLSNGGFSFSYNVFDAKEVSIYQGKLAMAALVQIWDNPCIKYTDFKSLFNMPPKEVPSAYLNHVTGGTDYIFQKDMKDNSLLILNVSVINACAKDIHIELTEKSTNKAN